jgi:hypothetical protein
MKSEANRNDNEDAIDCILRIQAVSVYIPGAGICTARGNLKDCAVETIEIIVL